jgi:hypothetical protein
MRSVFRGTRMDPGGAISVLTDAPAPEAHVTITICAPAKVRPADTAVDGNLVAPEPGSHKTHRWREMDSNHRSLARNSRFLLRKALRLGDRRATVVVKRAWSLRRSPWQG